MGSSAHGSRGADRIARLLSAGVLLLACASGVAHAQVEPAAPAAPAQAEPETAAPAQVEPEPSPAEPAEAIEPAEPPVAPEERALTPQEIEGLEAVDAAAASSTANLSGFREKELRAQLAVAQREEQEASTLWPWVTTIVGWGTMVAGTVIGVAHVAGCDEESCTGPYWPTWMVMGGSLVGSLGTVWLVVEERDIAELKIRRQRIERMIEEGRFGRASARAPSPRLTFAYSGRFDL